MTERTLQSAIYRHLMKLRYDIIVPNSCVYGWESDVVGVTKTGFAHEFEIKLTVADFKAEARKVKKFESLESGVYRYHYGQLTAERPNYFQYVVPEGLIDIADVPDFAGLIYVDNGYISVRKKPVKIHTEKVTDKQWRQMTRSVMYRYWDMRIKHERKVTNG